MVKIPRWGSYNLSKNIICSFCTVGKLWAVFVTVVLATKKFNQNTIKTILSLFTYSVCDEKVKIYLLEIQCNCIKSFFSINGLIKFNYNITN